MLFWHAATAHVVFSLMTSLITDTSGEHKEFENNIIPEISKYNFNNRDHVKMKTVLKETNWD